MKKLLLGLLGCVMFFGVVQAQQKDPRLYRGELETAQDVIDVMEQGEILPLYFNTFDSFNGEDEKQKALNFALGQVKKQNNAVTNYNVAVVYATADTEEGCDYGVRVDEQAATQAIRFASEAIKKNNEDPYAYLLRGEVLFEHSVDYSIATGQMELINKNGMQARAEQALADFEKVAELKPELAPTASMFVLAEALGDAERMAKYKQKDLLETSPRRSLIQRIIDHFR